MQHRTKHFVFVAICHFAKIWDGPEHPLLLALNCEMSSCLITNTNSTWHSTPQTAQTQMRAKS